MDNGRSWELCQCAREPSACLCSLQPWSSLCGLLTFCAKICLHLQSFGSVHVQGAANFTPDLQASVRKLRHRYLTFCLQIDCRVSFSANGRMKRQIWENCVAVRRTIRSIQCYKPYNRGKRAVSFSIFYGSMVSFIYLFIMYRITRLIDAIVLLHAVRPWLDSGKILPSVTLAKFYLLSRQMFGHMHEVLI